MVPTALLQEEGALQIINSSDALAQVLISMFNDKQAYQIASEAGKQVMLQNRGALAKQFALVDLMLKSES